jgi:hypothetical protein
MKCYIFHSFKSLTLLKKILKTLSRVHYSIERQIEVSTLFRRHIWLFELSIFLDSNEGIWS